MPTEQEIRERIVAVASREVNLVFANKDVGEGPDIKPARWGGRRLTVYFDEAAPVYKRANPKFNEFLIGPANHGRGLPAWCGIFALWAMRTAYKELGETPPVGTWHAGKSIPGAGGVFQIPAGIAPRVGDVGIEENLIPRPNGEKITGWHHFIIASDPVTIAGKITFDSVEGNAGNDGATASRRPKELKWPTSYWTIFASAHEESIGQKLAGRWQVKIDWKRWIYRFHSDHTVAYVDPDGTSGSGTGTWQVTPEKVTRNGSVWITWPGGTRDQWALPISATNQTGIWLGPGGRIGQIRAQKL